MKKHLAGTQAALGLALGFARRHCVPLLVTLGWALALGWQRGEAVWHSHSPSFEPMRAIGVLDAWRHGVWDARWLPAFDQGYGYPIFSYHSPLFSWVCAAVLFLTDLPVLSLRLCTTLFFVIGGLGCRRLAADYWGPAPGQPDAKAGDIAFIGWASASYLYINIFVRGSLAEFTAGCFFPWVVWGLWLLTRAGRRPLEGALVLSASLSLLILSHNAIAVYAILLLVLPLPLLLRPAGWRGLLAWMAAGFGAAGLTAFFALSGLLEQRFVALDNVTTVDVREHFLRIDHLLALSQWNLGSSGSSPAHTMPRHQGLLLPVALLAGVFSLAFVRSTELRRRTGAALALCAITLFMAMPASSWLWEKIDVLRYTQFPWRWHTLGATALALLLPSASLVLRERHSRAGHALFLCVVAVALALNLTRYGGPGPEWTHLPCERSASPIRELPIRTAVDDEYGPVWRAADLKHPVPAGQVLHRGEPIGIREERRSWRWRFPASEHPRELLIGMHYFPTWKSRWTPSHGGAPIDLPVENENGLVRVIVPAGESGTLELRFANTPLRFTLKLVSGFFLLAFIGAVSWSRKSRRQRTSSSLPAGPGSDIVKGERG